MLDEGVVFGQVLDKSL